MNLLQLILSGGIINNGKLNVRTGSELKINNNGTLNLRQNTDFSVESGAIVSIDKGIIKR
jgi:hypothetical protein